MSCLISRPPHEYLRGDVIKNKMPSRSRSRSFSRGRATKRYRSRSASRGSGMYAMATSPSRPVAARRRTMRVSGAHSFTRYASTVQETINGVFLARNYKFTFADLVQNADFASLFDQYRINKIVLTVRLINNPDANNYVNNLTTVNQSNWYPQVWYIPDYDGGSTETIATIKERQGVKCRILQPNKAIKITLRPKCRVLTYSTASSTGYSPKNIKIDMTDVNVEHFGLNVVFDTMQVDPSDTQFFAVNIERKYHFTCFGVR